MTLTLNAARRKGQRSRRTQVDWDVALERFSARYCEPHDPRILCDLETAWCDGWDEAGR